MLLSDGVDGLEPAAAAHERGVLVEDGAWHWAQPPDAPPSIVVGYGSVFEEAFDGTLYALDRANQGRQRFSYVGGSAQHFATPAAATGHVYAGLGGKLVAIAC